MTKAELNKYLVEIDMKLMNLYYKRDTEGKNVLDAEGRPINEYFQMTTGNLEIGEGWYQLIHDLLAELLETNWDKDIHQVKEKFGGLRFYIGGASEEVHDIIKKYEKLSYETCEDCGEQGELRRDLGWWRTLCDKYYNKQKTK